MGGQKIEPGESTYPEVTPEPEPAAAEPEPAPAPRKSAKGD